MFLRDRCRWHRFTKLLCRNGLTGQSPVEQLTSGHISPFNDGPWGTRAGGLKPTAKSVTPKRPKNMNGMVPVIALPNGSERDSVERGPDCWGYIVGRCWKLFHETMAHIAG